MSIRLFHFCAAKHRKSIQYSGINVGGVCEPTPTGFILHKGYMWLTTDPDPRGQSWATRSLVKYSRTEYRCTVEIPDECADRIMDKDALQKLFPGSEALFVGWPGSENWRVYRGIIPPEWITRIDRTVR